MYGGRGFRGFVLMLIGKMAILTIFLQLQDNIKLIGRFEGCYYTRLESYYIIFYFETDWSRIRPLPSTTLIKITDLLVNTVARNNLNCNLICRIGCYGYTVMIIE